MVYWSIAGSLREDDRLAESLGEGAAARVEFVVAGALVDGEGHEGFGNVAAVQVE